MSLWYDRYICNVLWEHNTSWIISIILKWLILDEWVASEKETKHDHSLTDVVKWRWEDRDKAIKAEGWLSISTWWQRFLTFFLSCAASFLVFVVCTVSAASEPSLMNVHGLTATQVKVILRASWPEQGLAGLSVPEAREGQTRRWQWGDNGS